DCYASTTVAPPELRVAHSLSRGLVRPANEANRSGVSQGREIGRNPAGGQHKSTAFVPRSAEIWESPPLQNPIVKELPARLSFLIARHTTTSSRSFLRVIAINCVVGINQLGTIKPE